MKVELLFPEAIGIKTNFLKEKDHKTIIEKSLSLRDSKETNDTMWLSRKNSPFNTFLSHNLIKDEDFSFLIEKTTQEVNGFAKNIYNDLDTYICQNSWANIYKSNNFQEPHIHANVMYSSVYFPLFPEGSGSFVAQKPFIDSMSPQNISESGILNISANEYFPEENSLLVFRSYIPHFVLPGTNKTERISIASNFVLKSETYRERLF